ncbi:MAG: hypothetical protein ACFB0B_21800, partial [Thermonemataceae bacterium]
SKGDTIQVAVDARYLVEASEQRNNVDINPIVQNTGSGSDNAADNGDTTPEWVLGVSLTPNPQSEDSGIPQAYVQYLLYDETGELLKTSGQVAISNQAKDGWETLTLQYIAEENGMLQVLALNNSDVEVYFENFQIEYAPTLIAQEQHFYPFGLQMVGMGKQGQPDHRWKYMNVELETHFDLNWYATDFRRYMPDLGRMSGIDERAEKYTPITPYHYAFNLPTIFNDPTGLDPVYNWDTGQYVDSETGKEVGWQATKEHYGIGASGNKGEGQAAQGSSAEEPCCPGLLIPANFGFTNGNSSKATSKAFEKTAVALPIALAEPTPLGEGIYGTATGGLVLWYMLFGTGDTESVPGDVAVPKTDTKTPKEYRVALGVEEYLQDFSKKVGAISYKVGGFLNLVETRESLTAKIIALGNQPNVTFHFNLSTPSGPVTDPVNMQVHPDSYTLIEYQIVSKLFPHKTTFYTKSGSIYKPINKK